MVILNRLAALLVCLIICPGHAIDSGEHAVGTSDPPQVSHADGVEAPATHQPLVDCSTDVACQDSSQRPFLDAGRLWRETGHQRINPTPSDDETQKALQFLEKADEFLKLGSQKDAVLFLGTSISIGNAFPRHSDGYYNEKFLRAFRTRSGEFLFEEGRDFTDDEIRHIFLESFVNADTAYYFLPDFSKVSRVSDEIISAYLIKRVLRSARSVKVILSVSYPSVLEDLNKEIFWTLVTQSSTLITDTAQFKDGVCLVVTRENDVKFEELEDHEIIYDVAKFLRDTKRFLSGKYQLQDKGSPDGRGYERAIQVIDGLTLRNDSDDYQKIGIIRGSEEAVKISSDRGRYAVDLQTFVQDCTANVEQNNDEFFFNLSDESRDELELIANRVNEVVLNRTTLIGRDILRFYRSREEQKGLSDIVGLIRELEAGQNMLSDMIRNISESPEPRTFPKIVANVLKSLEVNTAIENLVDVMRQCKYLDLLQTVCGQDVVKARIAEWVGPFNNVVNEIRESKKWFAFLVTVHDELLEGGNRKENVSSGHREVRSAGGKRWRELEAEMETRGIAGYEDIARSVFGDVKMRALRNVVRKAEKEKTTVSCLDGDKISARGTRVKVSEVLEQMNNKCEGKPWTVEIFASDTVLIDVDFDKVGEELFVAILAPRWNVTGQIEIKLQGSEGRRHEPQRAADATWRGHSGQDGKPGLPGGNAGSYFAIAREYLEGNVTVSTDGGRGGPGQDGGNGAEGRAAGYTRSPSSGTRCDIRPGDVRSKYHRIRLVRRNWRWRCFCVYDMYEYEFYDWGVPGGRGGNGGRGGVGGSGGEYMNIHLGESNSWGRKSVDGEHGYDGEGGTGGPGGLDGDIVTAKCTADWYIFRTVYRWTETGRRHSGGRGTRGEDGIWGGNTDGLTWPPAQENRFEDALPSIINSYKVYLVSSLDHVMEKQSLSEFITQLNSDPQVQSTYNTLAFVDELQKLETQFKEQGSDVDFLPLYQSLLQRIRSYAEDPKPHERSRDYKTVLTYLYTAALSKARALDESTNRVLVTNIEGYLNLMKEHIQYIRDINRLDVIYKRNSEYTEKIDEKISSANDFITKEILPEIEMIGRETERTIDELIAEVIEKQESARQDEDDLRKKRGELQNSLGHKIISFVVEFVTGALSSLSQLGQMAVQQIAQGSLVSKVLSVGSQIVAKTSVQIPTGTSSALQRQMDVVAKATFEAVASLRHEVTALLETARQSPTHLGQIEVTARDFERRLDEVGPHDLEKAKDLQDEFIKEISGKEGELGTFHGGRVARDVRVTRSLGTLSTLVTLADIPIRIYTKYKDDKKALKEMGDAITEAQNKFDKLIQVEQQVVKSVLPMIRAMQSEMLRVQGGLGSQSEVGLHVARWKIQSKLGGIKLQLQQFTNGFEVQENLTRCIGKLDEAMTSLIGVYEHIQHYAEKKELADYIADINSADSLEFQISDWKLQRSVIALEKTILSNKALGYYGSLVAALRQWVFPFAEAWLRDFKLPSFREENDSDESFLPVIIGQTKTLSSKLQEYKTSINKHIHPHIHTAEFHSRYKSTGPFFRWENQRYKDAILDLLAGKEVVLKADVLNGVQKNAVKFNRMEIFFKASTDTVQEKMEALLNHFHVKMTHHGNSYYRCGSKFYVIRSDNLTMEYSWEKKPSGERVTHNSVYTMLENGDLMLSPYAMWSIRLVNVTAVDFPELVTFGHDVDLELVGQGLYVQENADVCNHDLKMYYETEDSISEYDSVM